MEKENPAPVKVTRIQRVVTKVYLALAIAFLTAVVVQVFLAGAGTFSNGQYLGYHTRFVTWFQPIPVLLVIAAFIARMDRMSKIYPALAWVALVLQYEFVRASPHLAAGLHTVNALFIFWLAIQMTKNGRNPHKADRPGTSKSPPEGGDLETKLSS